jgi:hypothetical protein
MRGIVKKDEEGRLVVVYYKECLEDSDAVIRMSCRIMPGFNHIKEEDSIEFDLVDTKLMEGGFIKIAVPIIKINPHIANIMDTNEDGEANMGDKMAALLGTLKSKIYWCITNDGSAKGCGLAMKNAENIEKLFDDYALKLLEYYQKNMFNGKLAGLDREEILDKYKKKKGL